MRVIHSTRLVSFLKYCCPTYPDIAKTQTSAADVGSSQIRYSINPIHESENWIRSIIKFFKISKSIDNEPDYLKSQVTPSTLRLNNRHTSRAHPTGNDTLQDSFQHQTLALGRWRVWKPKILLLLSSYCISLMSENSNWKHKVWIILK